MQNAALRIGEEVGWGAGATVYRVLGDGRQLAGKIPHPSHGGGAELEREAELLEGLQHPNVVRVYGLVEIDARRVLLMELVPGPSLARLIAREAPLPEQRVLELGLGIAAGLEAAHAAGIVHRDLKPSNVLIDDHGTAKVSDFGLARAIGLADLDLAMPGGFGTPAYMAPESVEPLAADQRSDLYALGCILFEMLSGRPPFSGATPNAVLRAHREAPVPDLIGASCSAGLAALIRRLLAKAPNDRPQSAAGVVRALQALIRGDALPVPSAQASLSLICARCRSPLIPVIGVCAHCGLTLGPMEAGDFSVLIGGFNSPGLMPELDRVRLLEWLRLNPGLGIDPAPMERATSHLPFVLLKGLSPASAERIRESLAAMQIESLVASSKERSVRILRRTGATILLSGSFPLLYFGWNIVNFVNLFVPLGHSVSFFVPLGLAAAAAVAIAFIVNRPAVRWRPARSTHHPSLAAALARLVQVLGSIAAVRHRETIRGLVERVLAVARRDPGREFDGELAGLVDAGAALALRLDSIDLRLAEMPPHDPMRRDSLLERDRCATHLFELTQGLDAARERLASMDARRAVSDAHAVLTELGHTVAGLEEVARS